MRNLDPSALLYGGGRHASVFKGQASLDLKQARTDALRRRRSAIIAGAEHAEPALARREASLRQMNSVQKTERRAGMGMQKAKM